MRAPEIPLFAGGMLLETNILLDMKVSPKDKKLTIHVTDKNTNNSIVVQLTPDEFQTFQFLLDQAMKRIKRHTK